MSRVTNYILIADGTEGSFDESNVRDFFKYICACQEVDYSDPKPVNGDALIMRKHFSDTMYVFATNHSNDEEIIKYFESIDWDLDSQLLVRTEEDSEYSMYTSN